MCYADGDCDDDGNDSDDGVGGSCSCLCVFDVDRTLTGKQDVGGTQCPANVIMPGVYGDAYGGGDLTLSELRQAATATFCASCYLGVVSAGDMSGSGSAERSALLDQLPAEKRLDSGFEDGCPSPVASPLVLSCPGGYKQSTVREIVAWYETNGI